MNRKWSTSLLALTLCAGATPGQERERVPETAPQPQLVVPGGPGAESGPAPFGEGMAVLGLAGMHGGKVVTGAPFSAVAVSESVQTLADGNHITRKTQTNLYRDSQGRFRKEGTVQGFGLMAPAASNGQPKSFVVIMDPVKGANYLLHTDTKVAETMGRHGKGLWNGAMKNRAQSKFAAREQEEIANGDLKKEDLGTQTIAGVVAQGTRMTRIIPAGRMGNEKAITIVHETWYSSDLQMVVMSKRNDPWSGETTYTLTKIQQTEPDAALFTVPADYTVKPGHGPGPRGMMRGSQTPPPPPADN